MTGQVRHLAVVSDQDVPTWEAPVPFGRAEQAPPVFPLDVLPQWAAAMVEGVAVGTQTCPSMGAGVLLAVLSTCAGGRIEVEARPGWREPVNAYIAVIADPGERKTPVHSAFVGPLYATERVMADQVRPLIEQQAALKDIAERTAEQARATAAKADGSRRDELTAEAVAAVLSAEAITVPTLPRLIADDLTPERLIGLMAANGGRMALISDEGGIFDVLGGRFGSSPNLDPYLKGYNGRPITVDRQSRQGESVERPALTVGVMAQPSVLRKFGSNAELFGRGLPARFWFIVPRSLAGWRRQDAPPVPGAVMAGYELTVQQLAATLAEWEDPAVVTLLPDAERVRVEAAEELEMELRPGGDLYEMREWANKLGGSMLRIAGLLHVAHHPADAWRRPIDAATMTGAVKVIGWLIAHYRAALGIVHGDPAATTALHVLDTLINKGMGRFTRREIHRRVQRQLPRVEQVQAVLAMLAAHGWVRSTVLGDYELHPDAAAYRAAGTR
ncbi:YfjI family protein [Catelliglobosispora koreensis]|uniref:YfjI family protein n=1 Tax=Catelliglobosispora koreensis TaxID=129052 RepID=UPI00035F4D14|nr:YfjI family protein [Catelliglobosispora koreensis]